MKNTDKARMDFICEQVDREGKVIIILPDSLVKGKAGKGKDAREAVDLLMRRIRKYNLRKGSRKQ